MKILLSWMKDFVDIDKPPREIAYKLTMAGLEVEEVEEIENDYILDVSIPANRGDCQSILGIAREVSAIFSIPMKPLVSPSFNEKERGIGVEVLDPELCPRYTLRLISNVKVGLSPEWLRKRLEAVGIRSINNVVDITNYVMWTLGQPLHAFDADKIKNKVYVRRAYRGERITTLDDQIRDLSEEMLVIADEDGPIAVAGVMGGKDSEVTFSTKDIALESACFDNVSVRGTSKVLGLRTEASVRFEKGVDIGITKLASDVATEMIVKLCGGEIGVLSEFYPVEYKVNAITFRPERFTKRMGVKIPKEEIDSILHRLGFRIDKEDSNWMVTPISCRRDIFLEEDLYEEVMRIAGYERLPSTLHTGRVGIVSPPEDWKRRKILRKRLNSAGFSEVITSSFVPILFDGYFKEFFPEEIGSISVINPLREEESLLRYSISQALLNLAANNVRWGYEDFSLFEIGRVFYKDQDGYKEREHLGIIQSGRIFYSWEDRIETSFYSIKGALEYLFNRKLEFSPSSSTTLHPGRTANISYNGRVVGFIGEIHPDIARMMKLPRVYIAEIDLAVFPLEFFLPTRIEEPSRLPKLKRDIAVVVPQGIPAIRVIEMIKDAFGGILEVCELFDVYKGPNIPEGMVNLAFSLELRERSRTLTQEEVEEKVEALKLRLGSINGRLREW
ncbi:MAG: phenylalanine--tRNA ligase subunit beta [bacterium]